MENETRNAPESEPTLTPPPATKARSALAPLTEISLPLWVSLVLAVLVIIVFIWKGVAVSAVERGMETERQALEASRAAVQVEAQATIARHSDNTHALFGTALAWAIRGDMIRNNLDQIDQYFNELVRNERIDLVLLADPAGKVLVSSDRAFLDAPLPGHIPAGALQEPRVNVSAAEDGQKRLVVPIQGLNSRLGTVVLTYRDPS